MLKYNDPTIHETIERIEVYAGGFGAALMTAFRVADPDNKQRIIDAFPELFESYGPNSVFPSKELSVNSMGYAMVKHLTVRK